MTVKACVRVVGLGTTGQIETPYRVSLEGIAVVDGTITIIDTGATPLVLPPPNENVTKFNDAIVHAIIDLVAVATGQTIGSQEILVSGIFERG